MKDKRRDKKKRRKRDGKKRRKRESKKRVRVRVCRVEIEEGGE